MTTMIGCLPTQAIAFLAVFVYATHARKRLRLNGTGLKVTRFNLVDSGKHAGIPTQARHVLKSPDDNWRTWRRLSELFCAVLCTTIIVLSYMRDISLQVHKFMATLKPGFHYLSWRSELTARIDGWLVSITRQHGPCIVDGRPVSTSRVDGPCWRVMKTGHPSIRAVNSGRQLG